MPRLDCLDPKHTHLRAAALLQPTGTQLASRAARRAAASSRAMPASPGAAARAASRSASAAAVWPSARRAHPRR